MSLSSPLVPICSEVVSPFHMYLPAVALGLFSWYLHSCWRMGQYLIGNGVTLEFALSSFLLFLPSIIIVSAIIAAYFKHYEFFWSATLYSGSDLIFYVKCKTLFKLLWWLSLHTGEWWCYLIMFNSVPFSICQKPLVSVIRDVYCYGEIKNNFHLKISLLGVFTCLCMAASCSCSSQSNSSFWGWCKAGFIESCLLIKCLHSSVSQGALEFKIYVSS